MAFILYSLGVIATTMPGHYLGYKVQRHYEKALYRRNPDLKRGRHVLVYLWTNKFKPKEKTILVLANYVSTLLPGLLYFYFVELP